MRAIYIGAATKAVEQTAHQYCVEVKRMVGHPIGHRLFPTCPYIGVGESGLKGWYGFVVGHTVLMHQRIAHEIAHQILAGLPNGMVGHTRCWHTFGQRRLPTAEFIAAPLGRFWRSDGRIEGLRDGRNGRASVGTEGKGVVAHLPKSTAGHVVGWHISGQGGLPSLESITLALGNGGRHDCLAVR